MSRRIRLLFVVFLLVFSNCKETLIVYEEQGGVVAVEAEHFSNQTLAEVRQWFRIAENTNLGNFADSDSNHAALASRKGYVEILPDHELIIVKN